MTAPRGRIAPAKFDEINRAALGGLPRLLDPWLPKGRTEGREFVAINPTAAMTAILAVSGSIPSPASGATFPPATGAAMQSAWQPTCTVSLRVRLQSS